MSTRAMGNRCLRSEQETTEMSRNLAITPALLLKGHYRLRRTGMSHLSQVVKRHDAVWRIVLRRVHQLADGVVPISSAGYGVRSGSSLALKGHRTTPPILSIVAGQFRRILPPDSVCVPLKPLAETSRPGRRLI